MKPFLCVSEVAVLMTFCLLFSFVMPVYVAAVLGVNQGDWASYEVVSAWHSEIPGDTVPQYAVDMNHTEWRLLVKEILGVDRIRLNVTKYLQNGTQIEIYEGSVSRNSSDLKMWVVRKDLEYGDPVYDEEEVMVNDTQRQEFAGAMRSTVYAWFRHLETDGSISAYAVSWDRETGILCGMVFQYSRVRDDKASIMRARIKVVETSLWEPSGDNFWFLVLGVIILILVLVISVFVWKGGESRRRKTRKRSS